MYAWTGSCSQTTNTCPPLFQPDETTICDCREDLIDALDPCYEGPVVWEILILLRRCNQCVIQLHFFENQSPNQTMFVAVNQAATKVTSVGRSFEWFGSS